MKVNVHNCTTGIGRVFQLAASFILYLWQLPQNLCGLLLVALLRPEQVFPFGDAEPRARLYYSSRMHGGISLGRYLVVAAHYKDCNGRTEAHELGHYWQSLFLGPLYLLVIGLPSILWSAVWRPWYGPSYYDFYTEKWADKLGGVDRC